MKRTTSSMKRFLMTGSVVFGSLLLYYFFPLDTSLNAMIQGLILAAAFLLALPVLFVKFILKGNLSDIGFRRSARRFGWLSVPLVTITGLAIFFLLTRFYPVADSYYLPSIAIGSFPVFLLYEIIFVGAIALLYEAFFRGFVQLLWLGNLGWRSVFFQFLLFFGFFLVTNGITWQEAPILIASISSGFVAFYTRSVWYSFASAWLLLFLADAFMLVLG